MPDIIVTTETMSGEAVAVTAAKTASIGKAYGLLDCCLHIVRW